MEYQNDPILEYLSNTPDYESLWELELPNKSIENADILASATPRVRKLVLHHNQIQNMHTAPPRLDILDLSYNSLNMASHFQLDFLTVLNVSHNNLVSVGPLINLQQLTQLNCSYNQITSLNGIECINTLTALFADHNYLSGELWIRNERLMVFSGSHNSITHAKFSSPHLERVFLCNNQLKELKGLDACKVLSTRNNDSYLNYTDFEKLETLYMTGNVGGRLDKCRVRTLEWRCTEPINAAGLQDAQTAAFSGMFDVNWLRPFIYPIQHLELVGVNLNYIPPWFSSRFPCLTTLNLSFNNLDDDSFGIVGQMTQLRSLAVFKNQIKNIQVVANTLRNLPFLGAVDLRYNPLSQDYYQPLQRIDCYEVILQQKPVPTDHPDYIQYYRLMKGLGIWWLDGGQVSNSYESKVWYGKYGLASIRWSPDVELPGNQSQPHSQAAYRVYSADELADMVLDYYQNEFFKLDGLDWFSGELLE